MNNVVNICFITDNGYVQHTLVAMTSMLVHKYPTSNYNVFVICDNVDNEKKRMFKAFERVDCKVDIVDYNDNTYSKKEQEFGKYISSATYIRLKLPSIFPNVDRMLYLDGDIIVQDDLEELYEVDISNCAVAGVLDYGMCVDALNWNAIDYIHQTMPTFEMEYMNAGVLLMNLTKLRKDKFEQVCQELYNKRTDFIFADQDIINFTLVGKKKILPIYWNCPIISLHMNYGKVKSDFLHEKMAKIYHIAYKDIMDIVFKSRIIHINGNKKHIQSIPYLKALYERYIELAMVYICGRAK